jgi:hypothetical protein
VHQLRLNVSKEVTTKGMRVINVAVRGSNPTKYESYPSIIEVGMNKDKWQVEYGVALGEETSAKIETEEAEF